MVDLAPTIVAKSDQLNADDLIDSQITVRITKVRAHPDSNEQPISIHYDGDNGKPYKPCKSMRRVLVHVWGRDGNAYVGRSMTLYRDGKVQFGGIMVGGIRISHMSHIDEEVMIALAVSRGTRKPYSVKPLEIQPSTKDEKREAAIAWAKNHVDEVKAVHSIGELQEIILGAATELASLEKHYPDIHKRVLKVHVEARPVEPEPQPDDARFVPADDEDNF